MAVREDHSCAKAGERLLHHSPQPTQSPRIGGMVPLGGVGPGARAGQDFWDGGGGRMNVGACALPAEQFVNRHAEEVGNGGEEGDVGHGFVSLPAADGAVGDQEAVGHLLLGEPLRPAEGGDEGAEGFLFHMYAVSFRGKNVRRGPLSALILPRRE